MTSIQSQIEHLEHEQELLEADFQTGEHRLLDFYVKIMPKVMAVQRCSIFIVERSGQSIWLRAGTGLKAKDIEIDRHADAVVSECIRSGETLYKGNMVEEDGTHQDTDKNTGFVTRDILCMPIRSLDGKQVTGAVELLNKIDGEPYTDEEKDMLQELCHYLELSIENIYFQQEATDTIGKLYRLLKRTLAGGMIAILFILLAFMVYWFGFTLAG